MENTSKPKGQEDALASLAKKKKAHKILPESQYDILTVAENVCKKWENTPELTLLWVKPEDLKKMVQEYRTFLENRIKAGSGRSLQTQTLKNLDAQINKAVEEIKLAILVKFGKEKGKAYYSEFGITKQGNGYKLPTDRNLRLNALPLFVKGVKTHGLKVVGFDDSFFDSIVDIYTQAIEDTRKTDSAVSFNVSNKNDLRKQIEAVLTALYTLIKINYPNTYEGELRNWGFQREKY
ncbi:MAG: hypothetical protein NZ551_12045 [Microscillaceae bacterium]|nr:hypothetical protein [Microscillaceae bacterium]MDW8461926.1 hypothetical protein [Cytophagales bacterium]